MEVFKHLSDYGLLFYNYRISLIKLLAKHLYVLTFPYTQISVMQPETITKILKYLVNEGPDFEHGDKCRLAFQLLEDK